MIKPFLIIIASLALLNISKNLYENYQSEKLVKVTYQEAEVLREKLTKESEESHEDEKKKRMGDVNLNSLLSELSTRFPRINIELSSESSSQFSIYCDQPARRIILNKDFWKNEFITKDQREKVIAEVDFCHSLL